MINFLVLSMRLKEETRPGVVVDDCNPSTQEAEAEESQVQGQHGLHSETLSERREKEREKKKERKKRERKKEREKEGEGERKEGRKEGREGWREGGRKEKQEISGFACMVLMAVGKEHPGGGRGEMEAEAALPYSISMY
jgi:hypothetical protein